MSESSFSSSFHSSDDIGVSLISPSFVLLKKECKRPKRACLTIEEHMKRCITSTYEVLMGLKNDRKLSRNYNADQSRLSQVSHRMLSSWLSEVDQNDLRKINKPTGFPITSLSSSKKKAKSKPFKTTIGKSEKRSPELQAIGDSAIGTNTFGTFMKTVEYNENVGPGEATFPADLEFLVHRPISLVDIDRMQAEANKKKEIESRKTQHQDKSDLLPTREKSFSKQLIKRNSKKNVNHGRKAKQGMFKSQTYTSKILWQNNHLRPLQSDEDNTMQTVSKNQNQYQKDLVSPMYKRFSKTKLNKEKNYSTSDALKHLENQLFPKSQDQSRLVPKTNKRFSKRKSNNKKSNSTGDSIKNPNNKSIPNTQDQSGLAPETHKRSKLSNEKMNSTGDSLKNLNNKSVAQSQNQGRLSPKTNKRFSKRMSNSRRSYSSGDSPKNFNNKSVSQSQNQSRLAPKTNKRFSKRMSISKKRYSTGDSIKNLNYKSLPNSQDKSELISETNSTGNSLKNLKNKSFPKGKVFTKRKSTKRDAGTSTSKDLQIAKKDAGTSTSAEKVTPTKIDVETYTTIDEKLQENQPPQTKSISFNFITQMKKLDKKQNKILKDNLKLIKLIKKKKQKKEQQRSSLQPIEQKKIRRLKEKVTVSKKQNLPVKHRKSISHENRITVLSRHNVHEKL